jgi:hypothetical protein
MHEHSPYAFEAERAAAIRPLLRTLLDTALDSCAKLYD